MKKIDLRAAMKLASGKSLKVIVRKHKARLRAKYAPVSRGGTGR